MLSKRISGGRTPLKKWVKFSLASVKSYLLMYGKGVLGQSAVSGLTYGAYVG